jgi:hypothetical protein
VQQPHAPLELEFALSVSERYLETTSERVPCELSLRITSRGTTS